MALRYTSLIRSDARRWNPGRSGSSSSFSVLTFTFRSACASFVLSFDTSWSVASPLKNATAYVTLAPCSHVGKTPPCCDALVKAGCARVVIGMSDPAPWVSGNGARRLREGGVDVEVLEDAACLELLEGWVASLNLDKE